VTVRQVGDEPAAPFGARLVPRWTACGGARSQMRELRACATAWGLPGALLGALLGRDFEGANELAHPVLEVQIGSRIGLERRQRQPEARQDVL